MSYTDKEYEQLGGNIDPEIWKNLETHKAEIPLVGTLARLIYAEMNSDPVGQACVAQELHNRMRNWLFGNKAGISYLEEEYQNWYGYCSNQISILQYFSPIQTRRDHSIPQMAGTTKRRARKPGGSMQ